MPRGVVEDGKDKTQRLALTPASSNLPLTQIKTVRFIHTNQYADVCIVYMGFVCVCFIYAYFYPSGGYSWNLNVFRSIRCEMAVI